mmetsp:Transcript_8198/g.17459  ORF Transcript_8198/g.17459 Transcript_8198/m.17459 type:complete len:260 (-) Transcript_8198:160-939(-)
MSNSSNFKHHDHSDDGESIVHSKNSFDGNLQEAKSRKVMADQNVHRDDDGVNDDNNDDGDDNDDDGDPIVPVASIANTSRSKDDNESDDELDDDDNNADGDEDPPEAEEESASHATDAASLLSRTPPPTAARKRAHSEISEATGGLSPSPANTPSNTPKKSSKRHNFGVGRQSRTPAVPCLTIPFRQVKRTMKLDPDIGTVQNEAAMVATLATELFLKKFAAESYDIAKKKGRVTIRYEDVAEARVSNPALSFLDLLLP